MSINSVKQKITYFIKKYGITPKEKWSQNFLVSYPVITMAASYATGVVLEIGPGLGVLTAELAQRADKVIAVEKDKTCVEILTTEYDFDNVEIITADILECHLPEFDRVISNIPFHLSSPITFKLLNYAFDTGILFYQKEFAHRMVVTPPSSEASRLSVMVHLTANCHIVTMVPRHAFYPVPRTDSALVQITPFTCSPVDPWVATVIKGLFTHKNKLVKNALYKSADITHVCVPHLKNASIPYGDTRVFNLTIPEIKTLADWLQSKDFLCDNTKSI
ncbi:MAG: 16S rRNA (adenine(1518)-N(6)/adenine(1519)-N(6))-dimethyltransferase RsmA [Candidatus Methanofastidiosia archaeon]|jgi:16S rRNA (adenine1518-N6/adenine1519-N6)-dimethyltransferase